VQALELHTQLGDTSPAVPLIRRLVDDDLPRWASILAAALLRSGEQAEARELLDLAFETGFDQPRDLAWTYLMAKRAECAAALDDTRAAAEVTRLLTPWAGRSVVLGSGAVCLGAVSHYLGLAARTTGDVTSAVRHFEDSLDLNAAMNASWAARRSSEELSQTRLLLAGSVGREQG
jgi:hypothetical protein